MRPVWTIVAYEGRDGLLRLSSDWTRLVSAMHDAGRCELIALHAAGRCIASTFCLRVGHEYAVLKIG